MRLFGDLTSISVAALLTCIFLACADATAPPPEFAYTCDPTVGPDLGTLLDPLPSNGRRNIDDEWDDIARQVPGGWGGIFPDEGQWVMYLVDTTKYDEAVVALNETELFRHYDFSLFLVRQGLWDFAQLHDWQLYIVTRGVWPDGIISSDIDETRNRLVYGVLAEQGHIVEDFFNSLNLPCDLLLLEVENTPRNLQKVVSTGMIASYGDSRP